jgi:molybdopterin converting factor small subunit
VSEAPAPAGTTVQVRIPTILRAYTGGASVVTVSPVSQGSEVEGSVREVSVSEGSVDDGSAVTVADIITALEAEHPGIRARVLDELGQVRRFVNIYVEDDDVRFGQGLQTPVPARATVSIIPAVAGG